MKLASANKRRLARLAPLGLLLGGYVVWANTAQVRSAHGGWIADFNDPRQLVGAAQAVFVGRVVEQSGQEEDYPHFPRTQFKVEALHAIKSVRKLDPNSIESLPAEPAPLPDVVTVDQYGGYTRNPTGKLTLALMDGQHLLVPGQTYLLATAYDPERNRYHVLPHGAVPADDEDQLRAVMEQYNKAKREEIPFTMRNQGIDTPDPGPAAP
jgi:hypothetical protein